MAVDEEHLRRLTSSGVPEIARMPTRGLNWRSSFVFGYGRTSKRRCFSTSAICMSRSSEPPVSQTTLLWHSPKETLARHVAHLFARDPLVIFADRLHLDDEKDVDHFENLQSTNWQTLRWKPPHPAKGTLAKAGPTSL